MILTANPGSDAERAIELRLGDYRTALADVERVDCVITDPPYSPRTDKGYRSATDYKKEALSEWNGKAQMSPGHKGGGSMPRGRFELQYPPIDREWVTAWADFFVPRVRSWFVIFSDHVGARWWSDELETRGLLVFAPVPWVRVDSCPRFMADGPANACEWITIARPRGLPEQRMSRPGYYQGSIQGEKIVTGGKPLWLMRAIVRDYSRPGDLVCDPTAGGATTLLAARMEGRRAIGAEMDPDTFAKAQARLAHMPTERAGQLPIFGGEP